MTGNGSNNIVRTRLDIRHDNVVVVAVFWNAASQCSEIADKKTAYHESLWARYSRKAQSP